MRILVCIALAWLAFPAAAVSVSSASGASVFQGAASGNSATVFAGMAGDTTTCSAGVSPCNTCASLTCATAPLCACNSARPMDGGTVRLELVASGSGTTTYEAFIVKEGTTSPLQRVTFPNQGKYVDVAWTEICQQSTAASVCDSIASTSTLTAKVFLDKNTDSLYTQGTDEEVAVIFKMVSPAGYDHFNLGGVTEGIGGFVPYPGDEKVYITEVDTHDNWPTSSSTSTTYTGVKVYFSKTSIDNAAENLADDSKVLSVSSTGEISPEIVDGLENDTTYVFRVGLVDQAGNISGYFPDPTTVAGHPTCSTDFSACPWAATPEKVLGLLTDDFNCFIATAAYGSSMEPKLKTFRDFRFHILLRQPWGRVFVSWYYKYGPMFARYIQDKPVLRAMTRGGLWPVYLFSAASLKFGFYKALVGSLVLFAASIVTLGLGMRRVFARR